MGSADGERLPVDFGLHEVMKAVEAAEATIKQQVEENNRLREELQRKTLELEKHSCKDSNIAKPQGKFNVYSQGTLDSHQIDDGGRSLDESSKDVPGVLTVHQHSRSNILNHGIQTSETRMTNGMVKQVPGNNIERLQTEVDYDPIMTSPRHEMMQVVEVNKSSGWKQDAIRKIREHEEEISMLRKHLADYSIKEAQIHKEKCVLENRIAHMRLAFDQQHQDLVDAASKAISYRQEIIEENIHLTYALQSAQEEQSTFVSAVLPLLTEYSLQPSVLDAHSIVSNLKVLFKHLTEKLIATEAKLQESQYQMGPWHSDQRSLPPSSTGAALVTSKQDGLELVQQPTYSHVKVLESYGAHALDRDLKGEHQRSNMVGGSAKKNDDDLDRYSPATSADTRNSPAYGASSQPSLNHRNTPTSHFAERSNGKQVTFRDHVSDQGMDQFGAEPHQNQVEPSTNWSSGNPPYATPPDDPGLSYSPYLPAVLEEPSSSFSESADGDPLPGIEGLQISGDAFPGHELQACGYSINGTTSCNFEWVRHLEDGSVNYIDGAKQPNYLVTADDVDAYLAIEVQPLDDRKRKGELVKVFANDHQKIACDSEIHSNIEKAVTSGHASFRVSMPTGFLDIWGPATLTIKKEGYSIKSSKPGGVVVNQKFSAEMIVVIPYGQVAEFCIIFPDKVEHLLRAEGDPADVSCTRDTIVLILRYFITRAGEKRKSKKKGFFSLQTRPRT